MSYYFDSRVEALRNSLARDRSFSLGDDGLLHPTDDARQAWLDCYAESDEDTLPDHFKVSVRYRVCPTCDGHGSHVNPSIDAGGLSQEDFDDDPFFAEDYWGGRYDVPCYQCSGKRVVPTLTYTGDEAHRAKFDWLVQYGVHEDDADARSEARYFGY